MYSYCDACKFMHDSKAAAAHPQYEEATPPPAVPSTYDEDDMWDYENTWEGDYDERDFEDFVDATAYAFTKAKGKSKGKANPREKARAKAAARSGKRGVLANGSLRELLANSTNGRI